MDLVKVNIQTMEKPAPGQPPMYTGAIDCARKLIAKDGVRLVHTLDCCCKGLEDCTTDALQQLACVTH